MRLRTFYFIVTACAAVVLFHAGFTALHGAALTSVALTGQVSSAEEAQMEGVLVTAKKTGSTIATTVASDQTGHYSFPRNRLEPGQYSVRIRAVGFEMDDPGPIDISQEKTATADLKLHKASDLSKQLTNSEWMMSLPVPEDQKTSLLNCVQCHTAERIVKSGHDTDEFLKVIERMGGYVNQSFPLHPQRRLAERMREEHGELRQKARQKQAEFLASLHWTAGTYPLKTLDRPKGKSTHFIVTEYDLPKRTMEPHDVMLDSQGMAWFSDFGEQILGRLDPKTGKVTEFPVPELKHGSPIGGLGLQADPDGNLWLGTMYQGAAAKFDRKTEKFQTWGPPPEYQKDMTQINMAAPQHSNVDGKVWTQNNGFAVIHRIDLASGKAEVFDPWPNMKPGESHNIYDVIPDSHNNAYFTDFSNEHIGRVDAKTGEIKLWRTPTLHSSPRRGQMDSQDRVWFGEYRGNRIGMFDPKTEKFQEWEIPTPFSAPYDVTLDKNGEAWTGSMTTDRIARLNPKTGQITEYLLPRNTNIRRVYVDNTTTPVTFWVGSNHGASIVKLEVLD
jgi:virginiamycin B lyase